LPARVIIITGTPGVGKTTVAKKLVSRLSANLLSIGDLVRKENLVLEFDEERDTVIADMRKLSTRVKNIISTTKTDIVIEGHYAHDAVPRNVQPCIFVLRRDPSDLEENLKRRGYSERKITENVAAEILDVCLIGALKRFDYDHIDEIDITYMDVDMVVNEILSVLKGKKTAKSGEIDWLGRLEKQGRLEYFLSKMTGVSIED